jgi:DNA-binding NarL/FixJ family response regulator
MDGFDFLEKIKEEKLVSKTIKIILSNRGQPNDIIKGESLGASGYIVKASSTPNEVVEKVNQIVNSLI